VNYSISKNENPYEHATVTVSGSSVQYIIQLGWNGRLDIEADGQMTKAYHRDHWLL
jgi:hypothetical protein